MSLLIYKILNYDRFDKTKMTIDQLPILDDQSTKINDYVSICSSCVSQDSLDVTTGLQQLRSLLF